MHFIFYIQIVKTNNYIVLTNQSKTSPFQHFENKIIAILNEFKCYAFLHNEYLKLFEQ